MQLRHVLIRLSMCQEIFALKCTILAGEGIVTIWTTSTSDSYGFAGICYGSVGCDISTFYLGGRVIASFHNWILDDFLGQKG
jgi:hypothetical protein